MYLYLYITIATSMLAASWILIVLLCYLSRERARLDVSSKKGFYRNSVNIRLQRTVRTPKSFTCPYHVRQNSVFISFFSMALVKQWSRLLGHGYFRRSSCVALTNGPSQPIRRRTESKVVRSPFPDMEIPSGLLHEGVWKNLEKWPDKDALVSTKSIGPVRTVIIFIIFLVRF